MERHNESFVPQYDSLINEMGEQNFEVIRFSSYRTAAKLSFIQKKTNFDLIDIWNAIEAIRENGLHNYQDIHTEIDISKLEILMTSIYYQLSKRLPPSQMINLDESISYMFTWIIAAYDPNGNGKVRVFAIKIAFAIMCMGKLTDKLRYIFSLISDPNKGFLLENRFNAFLREAIALPCSVFETAAFQYDESLSSSIFDFSQSIDIYAFLDVFLNVNSPPLCISWVVILHRMTDAERVVHLVQCDACHRNSFNGFRYKCQKCFNYTLCQDCFWRGRTSASHNADTHPCKEYAYWKSQSQQIGHSLRKSFRCVPTTQKQQLLHLPEDPPKDKRINLTHIVPPSPVPSVHHLNGFNARSASSDLESLYGANSIYRSPPSTHMSNNLSDARFADDEHHLIARYASKLAKGLTQANNDASCITTDISQQQKMIAQLEAKNREIMKEIIKLRSEHHENELRDNKLKSSNYPAAILNQNHALLAELGGLRQRKEELETHLGDLQESRRELMVQLECLMKLLKNHGTLLSKPASGSNSASSTLNRPIGAASSVTTPMSMSTPNVNETTNNSGTSNTINRDLLVAADSVTNAMSSLVKELNSEDESESLTQDFKEKVIVNTNPIYNNKPLNDEKQVIDNEIEEEKLALNPFTVKTNNYYDTMNSTYITTDDESYVRTDEELDDTEEWDNFIESRRMSWSLGSGQE